MTEDRLAPPTLRPGRRRGRGRALRRHRARRRVLRAGRLARRHARRRRAPPRGLATPRPTRTTTAAPTRVLDWVAARLSPRILEAPARAGRRAPRARRVLRAGAGATSTCRSTGRSSSPFGRRVLEATAAIPFGEVDDLRRDGGRRPATRRPRRAAGRALGANPIPIVVPCHRVIGASGAAHRLHRRPAPQGGAARARGRRPARLRRDADQPVAGGRAQVEHHAPDAVAVDEPGLAQDAQVLGDATGRDAERARQVGRGARPVERHRARPPAPCRAARRAPRAPPGGPAPRASPPPERDRRASAARRVGHEQTSGQANALGTKSRPRSRRSTSCSTLPLSMLSTPSAQLTVGSTSANSRSRAAVGHLARAVEHVALEQRAQPRPVRRHRAVPVDAQELDDRGQAGGRVGDEGLEDGRQRRLAAVAALDLGARPARAASRPRRRARPRARPAGCRAAGETKSGV